MPTNEAGLSGGKDQGDGGRTQASDTPGGERNTGMPRDERNTGEDRRSTGRASPDASPAAGHLGAAGDPAEGKTDPSATGRDAEGRR